MGIAGQTSAYTLYLLDDSSIEDILTPPLLVIWVNILQIKRKQLKTQKSTHPLTIMTGTSPPAPRDK